MAQMANARIVYSGVWEIDNGDQDFDISVNLPNDPICVVIEPDFTPTYGVSSTLAYMIFKCAKVAPTSLSNTSDGKKYLAVVSEGRSNYANTGYELANTYPSVLDDVVLSKQRIKLGLRNKSSFPWAVGKYKWYAFC